METSLFALTSTSARNAGRLNTLFSFSQVVKYWRARIQERRSRLTPANLKKIPTKKYKEGIAKPLYSGTVILLQQ